MRRGGCRPPRRGSLPASSSAFSCSALPGGIASRDLRPSLPQHLDQHARVAPPVESRGAVIVSCGGAISRGLLRAAPGRLIALGQRFGAERRLLLLGDEQPLELDRI